MKEAVAGRGFDVRVDRAACQGAGACVRRAPGSFALDGARKSAPIDPPGDDEAALRDAAAACPYFAIALVPRGAAAARANE